MTTIENEVAIPRPMLDLGGIHHTLRAHAICANCTHFDDYSADPEAVTLEQFATDARRYFGDIGWRIGRPKTLCRMCSAK